MVLLAFQLRAVLNQSETVWRQADKYEVPRIAFVNKMDRSKQILQRSRDVGGALRSNFVPIQLPIGAGETFNGMVDLIEMIVVTFEESSQGSTFVEGDSRRLDA